MSNKPGHRGEREVSRKTIARGMPGDFRCDRGDYARVFVFYHTRGCGCIARPAFPAPSEFRGREIDGKTSDASRRENAESCFGNWGNFIAKSDLSALAQRAKAEATKQLPSVIPGWCASTRPQMRNCTSENLEIPGLVLTHHPGMTS